ncbi:hypothetical protein O7634_12485 [Micromonospora sp. WMMD1120]|uniref:hypothetical protein n=1 Tax=Micromonospora sp. WMMD1120 TaxID=3016106 RepID=UPI002415F0D3|nr:hypothetical protein [Micromonospora sp. WMMD1120]MDG4807569.1 hypothetical protein [Micromonospora sp. WMMD1120]
MTATPVRVLEPRRWAAFHCFGIMDLLLMVHASHEDVIGAVDSGQLAVARFATREVVLRTSAVRSLWTEGFPADPTDALADPFAGLDPQEIQDGLDLVRRMVRATDTAEAATHLPAIDAYVRRLESDLGYPDRAPSVRRPEGTFPALRMVRQILPINRAAHLPSAMPAAWLPDGGAAAHGSSGGPA